MSAVGTAGAPRMRAIRGFADVPTVVPAMIAAAWVLGVVAEIDGAAFVRDAVPTAAAGTSQAGQSPITFFCPLHLAAAGGSGLHVGPGSAHAGSFWLAFALFLIAWQAMIVAMMLPSSLPLVRLFSVASAGAPARGRALLAFLSGYALIWTAFGAVAFAGDALVHRLIADDAGLRAHTRMIVAGLLALAGAVQFTSLKDRCLTECRHPGAFLMRHYRGGTSGAFMLGRRHGLFCLGCCWALMLVMFVAGVANLICMGALTVLMVYEKTATRGATAVPIAGIALLALAAVILVDPHWLPATLGGGL
jgi:predicted metal-binding membrane protein